MRSPFGQQVDLLLKQNRHKEAIALLRNHLAQQPDDVPSQIQLAAALFMTNELRESREIAQAQLAENPLEFGLVNLLAEIDLSEEKYADAQNKANYLLEINPENSDLHLFLARITEAQRYYDAALTHLNQALALEPDNINALNLKAIIADRLGNTEEALSSIDEVLSLDPENPTSIANHGLQLLNQGKTEEALHRFEQALAIQPSNPLARHGMQEALKSKFWIYRLFFQYQRLMQKLSGNQAWLFIIGSYIVYRLLFHAAANTEGITKTLLTLLVILIAASFLLSWVINPLMNLYLSTNKYGRILLDKEAKTMAKFTGLSLAFSLILLAGYFLTDIPDLLVGTALFAGLMIPAGTFLLPSSEERQDKLKYFGLIILILGVAGLLTPTSLGNILFGAAVFGLLGYQFYFNRMMINDYSRKFEQK